MIQGAWKSDGLDKDGKATCLIVQQDVPVVSTVQVLPVPGEHDSHHMLIHVTGGSPMNLYYDFSTLLPPKYFYQVEILDTAPRSSSRLSVGVVRPSEFRKGWAIRGLFYNGNLTNGSAALHVSYGPYIKKGDVVLVEYTHEDFKHQVKFHVNGTCLGTAFEIPQDDVIQSSSSSSSSLDRFYPCLQIPSSMTLRTIVSLEQPPPPPTTTTNTLPGISDTMKDLEGDWTLIQLYKAPDGITPVWPITELHEDDRIVPLTPGDINDRSSATPRAPTNREIILHMESWPRDASMETGNPTTTDAPNWLMALKVCNTMRVTKMISRRLTDPTAEDVSMTEEYHLSNSPASHVLSTRMMPPPPLCEVETNLSQALASDWEFMQVMDDDNHQKVLQALSSNGTILARFHRRRDDPGTTDGTSTLGTGTATTCTSYR